MTSVGAGRPDASLSRTCRAQSLAFALAAASTCALMSGGEEAKVLARQVTGILK